jgi:hypothetical protein
MQKGGHESISSWQPTEETSRQPSCWHCQCSNDVRPYDSEILSLSVSLFPAVHCLSLKTREDSGYPLGTAAMVEASCRTNFIPDNGTDVVNRGNSKRNP